MRLIRENTIVADFKNVRKKPFQIEIHKWIKETFNFSVDQVCGIQCNTLSKKVYIKLISNLLVKNTLKKFETESPKFIDNEGIRHEIPLEEEGQDVVLRIYDLPLELKDCKIKEYLSIYGSVKSVRREKCSGSEYYEVENGIRSVLITMKKPIPSYISIESYTSLVVYKNQIRTCVLCNKPGHERRDCPDRIVARIQEIRRPQAPVPTEEDQQIRKLYSEIIIKNKYNNDNGHNSEQPLSESESNSTQTQDEIISIKEAQPPSPDIIEATPQDQIHHMEGNGGSKRCRDALTSSEEEGFKPLKTKFRKDKKTGQYVLGEQSSEVDNEECEVEKTSDNEN
ncbi:uncharacterized protein LOC126738362 [Anthonomus grandis grandis]|uniref:uncharacterized protein LOC126738362 n=1 Tax=Anthonomus grandis grandis TaxID=2921223 RepID=UPI002166A610|nr:uncharacterized protein LOC126738362 [Anthonomus grandis grandis]